MKRFPYFALVVWLILSSCSIPGMSLLATATSTPTNTPEPTFTPLPTDTPTPEPSPTPNITATAAAQATESASSVLAELDKYLDDSDISYKNGHLLWQQTKPLAMRLSGPESDIQKIEDDLTAENFVFKSDVTWEATGLVLCGAAFRSEPDVQKGKQYLFSYLRLSGLPAWAIEVYEFGQYKNSPTDVRFSAAVDLKNGAKNTFMLVVQDDSFTVYINRVREGKFFDYSKQRSDGAFAFMASQDSGTGSCEFENSWVWSLDE